MSTTRISDVIVPSIFAQYVAEESVAQNKLLSSGIITTSPVLSAKLNAGGAYFDFPFWKHLDNADTEANVPSDDPTSFAVPEKMTSDKQRAVRISRNRSVQGADLAAVLAGSNPMEAAAAQIVQRQNSDRMKALLAVLAGSINETNTANLVHTVALETTVGLAEANKFNASNLIDATANAWGDTNGIAALVVHSKTYAAMQKANLVTFVPTSAQSVGFGTYLGMYTLIVDDKAPVRAGTTSGLVYTSYVLRTGGVQFGIGLEATPIAFERSELAADGAGVETLIHRQAFTYHVVGMKTTLTANAIPSNATLATAGSWTKVFQDKACGVAAIVHNL